VAYGFIMKLEKNPRELEVLGDGTQTKSYLHIDGWIDALLRSLNDVFCRTNGRHRQNSLR
jgi:UDP-glucose 4-epimerase